MRWLVLVLLLNARAALAQIEPVSSNEDSRIGVIHYVAGQEFRLRTVPGVDVIVLTPRGEKIQSVTVDDPDALHVRVSDLQDGFTLLALNPISGAGLSVRTETQTYNFLLTAAFNADPPYLIRIDNNAVATASAVSPRVWTPPVVVTPGQYKLSGNKEVRPTAIRDDGAKIYIEWSGSQALPAVFALNGLGQEEMVNGYMRDGTFTIDRIYDRLVFRIDKAKAMAHRFLPKVKK